jgi:RNA polymerase sigma-70 factor (ECF subfamily)
LGDAVARARSGDETGFFELWQGLQPRLLRYLRVLDCDDPDDIASETWLAAFRDLPRFRGGDEDFPRWIFTIARHRAIDAARARSRRPTTGVPEVIAAVPDGSHVEEEVLHSLAVARAIALLTTLPADQAEAVALRVLAGLDNASIARILGKTPGAIRVCVHRGLRTLAKHPDVRALAATRDADQAQGNARGHKKVRP